MKKLNELQSYLTRLRGLMLTLIILCSIGSGNVWGETVGPETISLTSGWTNKSGTTYCGGYGKNSGWYVSDYAITALSTVLSDPSNSGFSLTIEVKCLCNTALSGYSKTLSVVLLDKNNSTVGSAQTITNLATGNNSTSATWKTFTFTPTSAVTGYKIYGGKGCAVYSTKYTLNYTAGAPTPTHTLGSAVSPAASGTVDLSATTVEEGGTATATATPNSGYRFSSWAISGTGASLSSTSTNPTTVTMGTANATVTANFVSKGCTEHAGTNVVSGSTASNKYGPVSTYYKYSTKQILYTKTDLGLAEGKKGTIKSIYFDAATATTARNITIYMANSSLNALSTSNYVEYGNFTQVFTSDSWSCSTGWNEIDLDTDFEYNGVGNLVVLIDDNSGFYKTSETFNCHDASTTTGAQIWTGDDETNENPSSTTWSNYEAINTRPNTKFCIEESDMTPATVTLMDNGATITEVSAGAGVTLPSRTGCTGYTFAGWTKSWVTAQTSWTTTAPTIIPAGSYTPSGDENLYPVYTKTEGGSGFSSYTKVTSAQSDWSGKYLISDGTLTATGNKFSSTALEVTTLTPGTTEYTSYEFTITKNGNNSNYFIITPDGTNYVGYSGSSAGLAFTTSTPASNNYLWTCSTSDPMTLNVGTNTRYIGVGTESSTDVFKAYSTSGTNAKCYLYKRIEGGSTTYYISVPNCCTDPELGYATASVTKTYGDAAFTNTLTNSHNVAVTYSSSDTDVATVASDGTVTIKKAGTTTITASSIAQTVSTVDYCADEASYTLTVNKADISPTLTYSPNSVAVDENSATPTVGGNSGSGGVTYAITSATPSGCATINTSTGVVTGVAVGSVTVTATVAATDNYNGNTATATVTITAATNFPNNKTIFIWAHSTSAWTGGGCVKAWFHTAGGSETAQSTYWLFDATGGDAGKKLFAAVVPASGNLPYLDIQRFAANCNDWWNKNGGCSYADADGSNAVRTEGKNDDASDGNYVFWNDNAVTLELHGDPSGDAWASSLASFSDQGAGVWTATYNNYAPANAAGESQEFKAKTNYNGWIGNTGSNNNATLDGMHVGSTYNITATLDVTDHSLTMSKTFVKGTVHFDLQGHGLAISDLTNVTAGSKISAPSPAPTASGWHFIGWYKEPACTNAWNFASDVVNETMTLYAKWVQTFTVTYDANGGSGTITDSNSPYDTGSTVTVKNSTGFTGATGKEFDHWNTSNDNNGTSYAPDATFTISANTTLFAQWRDVNYTVTMAQSPAAGATLTGGTTTAHYGGTINISTDVPSGYRFNGWTSSPSVTFVDASATSTSFTMPASDVTITANFVQTHTVTWLSNGSNYVSPVTYDHGAELALPAGTPSAPGGCSGKVFVGWTSDPEISTETSTKPTIISAGGAVTGGATYRAVFADRGGSGESNTYTRLETVSELYDGMKIVIVASQNSGAYLQQTASGITKYTSSIPKSTDEDITVTTSSLIWTLEAGTGVDAGKWRLLKDASNKLVADATPSYTASGSTFSIEDDSREFIIYNGSCYGLEYYGATPQWKFYSPSKCNIDYGVYGLWLYGQLYDNYITLCSTCTTPSDVAASGITTDGATITWNGTSQENNGGSGTGFVVKYGTNSTRDENSNTINVAAGTNTADLTGLAQGTKYYVWVQSKCDNSWSTTPAEFTTLVSHTATFIGADGSTLQSSAIVEGESVTYSGSTPVSCDTGDGASTTFVGWATDTWTDKKAAKGNIPVGTTFYDIVGGGESLPNMGNGDVTYYAVFAKATGDPLTNHVWEYTFTTNKYGSSGTVLNSGVTKTLDGTDNAVASNKDWTLQAYGPLDEETWEYANVATDTKDNTKGIKIGTGSAPAQYMYFNSSAFTGTVTAVKISTSGGSMTQTTVGLTVDGTDFLNSGNATVYITNSNTEYSFTGSKTISGDAIAISWYQATTTTALYIKKIEVDYTTGGDVSYSNYMTTCSQCVTPNSVTADAITEAGATINWAGTSKTGTTGFTVLWGTDGTRANNSNSANVDADTKTYSITGLSAGTTYYVWVQSRCDDSWSDRISFTTLAVHDITFTKDNGTLSVASPVGVVDGQTLTFPNVTSTSCGTFVGWKVTEVSDYDNVAAPSPLYKYNDTKENITADESYQAVYRTATGAETNVTDNITVALTGITGTYGAWSDKTATSVATYAGNTAKNSTNQIQMRASDASGIVSTTSGGKLEQVIITWASNTSGRKVQIYGKTTPYSATSDLYSNDDNVKGTLLEELEYTSDGGTSTLDVDGTYNYIGIKSKSGAAYMTNIAIKWFGSEAHYMTAPTCNAMVGITSSFSSFTYVYGSGPSTAQSFIVSGINLSEALIVTAPTNYEVCKTADGTYTSSVSFTPAAGKVSAETVYIRLAAGLNVGTYNYDAANGVSVASNSATPQTAALNGSVTKAAGAIAFTDFNAVDHYEAELEKGMSDIDVTLTVSVTGDGSVSYSKSPAAGVSPTIPATQPTTTLHVLQPGIWTVTATLIAGTNYTGANTNCEVRVKRVDTYVDFIHNKTIKAYGSGSTVVDGKMEDWGSGYTVPYIDDNATETSGSCQQTHFKFMGWVVEDEINIADGTFKTGWTLIEAGTASKTATTKTYYAVWAKLED